ncbi:hypothetical protein LL912_23505 [Niabella sp. CC-SYL272]|uniref:hypothetical protein n=1 Tax=Niabella agricola TaxID=2891571 RepID=UPI001F335D99|nr:hypothetical protein [Niabella agricola]MCF3111774.1 hypothetical protein [Niabella agricola]
MKKLLLIVLLFVACGSYAQLNGSGYSTSFGQPTDTPSLGVAIPYNGIYDNFEKKIAGTSHWDPPIFYSKIISPLLLPDLLLSCPWKPVPGATGGSSSLL